VGERLVDRQITSHAVHYSGKLSQDGREIEGKWWIDPKPESGSHRTEGEFTLERLVAG